MSSGLRRILSFITALVILAAGVFMIIQGVKTAKNRKIFTPVTGTITRIYRVDDGGDDYHFDVFVKYTADGKEYESLLGEYNSSYREGAVLEIMYDPADPQTIISAGPTQSVLMIVMGVVAILAAAVFVLKLLRGY